MTPEKLALTPRVISRIFAFIVTLGIGISLSQVLPLRFWQAADSNNAASTTKQIRRGCPNRR